MFFPTPNDAQPLVVFIISKFNHSPGNTCYNILEMLQTMSSDVDQMDSISFMAQFINQVRIYKLDYKVIWTINEWFSETSFVEWSDIWGCLVSVFKQQFSVFKQHFTYFNTLFQLSYRNECCVLLLFVMDTTSSTFLKIIV